MSQAQPERFLLFFAKIAVNGEKSNSIVVLNWKCGVYDFVIFVDKFPNFGDCVPEIKSTKSSYAYLY